ncbi:MAG: hypothetical protein NTZ50_13740 [Chloroflexi bacterium]|nr:hypothetical protein [Chloroflexota bacterium]
MADTPIRDRIQATKFPAQKKRRQMLPALVTALFACLMATLIAGSGLLGARDGQRELAVRRTATIESLISQRFNNGLRLLNEGNYALAQANLEEVLRYQQGNHGARDLLATAIAGQVPTATPLPKPTATAVVIDKAALLKQARAAANTQDWDATIALTDQLIAVDNKFQFDTVADLRYEAFVQRGLAEINNGAAADLESGIFDLDQAAAIRALPANAAGAHAVAVRYQTAVQYIGADWDAAIRVLKEIPGGYRDVAAQLRNAYIAAAESYANAGNWCEAKRRYDEAGKALSIQSLEQKASDAASRCTASGGALSEFTVLPAMGVSGNISFRATDAAGFYQNYAYDAARAGVFTQSLGFSGAGIYSPDGSRYVLSESGQIIVHGAGQSAIVAAGIDPQWGPGGIIAFQGCTDGICGIHLVNPDVPNSLRRITSSSGDIGYRWSPAGDQLAFTANHTGAWEIFAISIAGDIRPLTTLGSASGAPSWSPNGAQIAFISNRDGGFGLFAMNADGSGLQKLVDFGAANADWQGATVWVP